MQDAATLPWQETPGVNQHHQPQPVYAPNIIAPRALLKQWKDYMAAKELKQTNVLTLFLLGYPLQSFSDYFDGSMNKVHIILDL